MVKRELQRSGIQQSARSAQSLDRSLRVRARSDLADAVHRERFDGAQ
jgi:hypothetical protein